MTSPSESSRVAVISVPVTGFSLDSIIIPASSLSVILTVTARSAIFTPSEATTVTS